MTKYIAIMLMFGFLFVNGSKNLDLPSNGENSDNIKTEAREIANNKY